MDNDYEGMRVVPIHERLEAFALSIEAASNELESASQGNSIEAAERGCRQLRLIVLAMYVEARRFREFEEKLNTEKVG